MKIKKAKMNSVLVKKLEELDSLEKAFNDNNDPNLYRKIQLRVIYVKSLLTAEILSRQIDIEGEEDSEERLKHACMARRLTELSHAFSVNQLSGDGNGSLIEPEMGSLEINGETGSVYSWVESCQDEAEEEADQQPLVEDASSVEKRKIEFPGEKEEVVVEKRRLGFGGLVCFGLICLVGGIGIGYVGHIIIMKEDVGVSLVPT